MKNLPSPIYSCSLRFGLAASICAALTGQLAAQSVEISYASTSGTASFDPITVPNPDTEFDIVVAPSLEITAGKLVTSFLATSTGQIRTGNAHVDGIEMNGSIDIALQSSVEVFGFPVTVTANLAGPLTIRQVSSSQGMLLDSAQYIEWNVGMYDIMAGPLECSDSAFGVFCSTIESGLGVEFPLAPIATEGSPLPLSNVEYGDLDAAGMSIAMSQLAFSVPLGDAPIGASIDFSWAETDRQVVVPEPTAATLIGVCLLVLSLARRFPRTVEL